MRNHFRSKLEYILYGSVVTTTTLTLGLALIFGFDEEGKKRQPVWDQPIEESFREARVEMKEYQVYKAKEFERWMYKKGYQETYEKWFGNNNKQIAQQQQEIPKAPESFLEQADSSKK